MDYLSSFLVSVIFAHRGLASNPLCQNLFMNLRPVYPAR